MKFKIERKIMQEGIAKVGKAITGKLGNPILDGMYIKASNNQLTLIGSDGDTTIKTTVAANVTEDGEIIIEPKILGEIIRKLPDEEVYFATNEDDQLVQIKCFKSDYSLVCNNGSEYPSTVIENTVADGVHLELEQGVLKNMVKSVQFAAADSDARPVLKGIYLEAANSVLTLVAIDGYRLAKKTLELDTENEVSAIIDAKLFNDISKLWKDNEEKVALSVGRNQIGFEFDDTTVTLRLIDGNFISYQSLIPSTESASSIQVKRTELIAAINRVSVMSDSHNHLAKLDISDRLMVVSAKSNLGQVTEDIELSDDIANPLTIAFNAKYLLDVLNVIDDENVILHLISPVSPCVMQGVNDTTGEYLVLPVRMTR